MATTARGLETTARAIAARRGYKLVKPRRVDRYAPDYGQFVLLKDGREVLRTRDLQEVIDFTGGYAVPKRVTSARAS